MNDSMTERDEHALAVQPVRRLRSDRKTGDCGECQAQGWQRNGPVVVLNASETA
jgi:hypothetical protein